MIVPNPKTGEDVVPVVQGLPQKVVVEMGRVDIPPPYIQHAAAESPVQSVPPEPTASSSLLLVPEPEPEQEQEPSTNIIYIKTRHSPLNGVFRIDPGLDTLALDKIGLTAIDRREYNQKHRQKHRHHARAGFWKRIHHPTPNAIFQSRQGDIALDLSVVAGAGASSRNPCAHALIQAASRHGTVDINVREIQDGRLLNMEVSTRNGDVHILIPRSFSGYIQLYSHHGNLVFLPTLTNAMRLVLRRDKEAQVVVGDALGCTLVNGSQWNGGTIHVASRRGNISVGYILEDTIPDRAPGFWKTLVDKIKGEFSLQA